VLLQQQKQRCDAEGQLEAFYDDFLGHVKQLLVIFNRSPAVERVAQFFVDFAVYDGQDFQFDEVFFNWFLSALLGMSKAKEKAIRFRVCQLVSGLMAGLVEDAEIGDDMWDDLQKRMLDRVTDKVVATRVHAVAALKRLQDPTDRDDPVVKTILVAMETDSAKEVRKTAIKAIGLSRFTIQALVTRTRDISEEVRKEAFRVLTLLDLKAMSIFQRVTLASNGVNDRDEGVHTAFMDMVMTNWLKRTAGLNNKPGSLAVKPAALLRFFDVENYESEGATLARAILKETEHGVVMPNLDTLDAEGAQLWRVHCQLLHEHGDPEITEFLPTVARMCGLLDQYRESPPILSQLLKICVFLESDVAGRR
jgi:condensin complex subunit 3